MSKISYLTQEGYQRLKSELQQLESVERPAISQQIAEARDKGDLSENAEYDAAKEAQGLLEMKIAKLKTTIAGARIIDESKIDSSSVQLLTRVKIQNTKNNMVMQYAIVPESESNIKQGKISVETPIARGLMGKKVDDVVKIQVPSGILEFKILEISTL